MKYRSEIDGLRAIAVLPVMFFHAGFETFSGGFVGVDIFFVISGYLITTIILSNLQSNSFTLIDFYERRARRILPELFFVLAFTLALAWLLLLPEDFRSYGKSLAAVPLFSSNIYFWKTSGYFDTITELKPLIHTWTLALEEQYYLLFPVFFLVVWKFFRRWSTVILIIAFITSLTLAHILSEKSPSANFYLLPTRAWELTAGALLAIHLINQRINTPRQNFQNELGGGIGITLISYSIFSFTENTPSPSLYTLAPTMGTVMVIAFTNKDTRLGQILSNKLLVFVGVLSYGAYLWHQPIFAFTRHYSLEENNKSIMTMMIAISLLLAYASWRTIGQPVRKGAMLEGKKIFVFSICVAIFFIIAGLTIGGGHVKTYKEISQPELTRPIPKFNALPSEDCGNIFNGPGVSCKKIGSGSKLIVIWGDSHAGVLRNTAPHIKDTQLMIVSHAGCPPLIGVRRFDNVGNGLNCNQTSILTNYATTIKSLRPDDVILIGRWTLYLNGWRKMGALQNAHHFLNIEDNDASTPSPAERVNQLQGRLEDTVKFFGDSNVTIISQAPDYAETGYRKISTSTFEAPLDQISRWHRDENLIFEKLTEKVKFNLINTKNIFCKDKVCRTRNLEGDLLYGDDNHLSDIGSLELWNYLIQSLRNIPTENIVFPVRIN